MLIKKGFVIREDTDSHNNFIRHAAGGPPRARNIKSVLECVFSHQKAVYKAKSCNLIDDNNICGGFDFDNPSRCEYERSALFYLGDYYIKPVIHHDVSTKSKKISLVNFVNRLNTFPNENVSNIITFLLGNVGTGKTAFINYLISSFGQDWFHKNILFIRLGTHTGPGEISYDDLLTLLYRKLKKIFNSEDVLKKFKPACNILDYTEKLEKYDLEIGLKETALSTLFREIRKTCGFTVLIMIDNIDQIYHKDDRQRFLKNIPLSHDSIKPMIDLVSAFFHNRSELGSVGAHIVFSMRTDTYDILSKTIEYVFSADNITKHNMNAFTLGDVDWNKVVANRFEMLKEISQKCGIVGGKREDLDSVIGPILSDLDENDSFSLLNQMKRVSSFGLRCVMDTLSNYSWINNDTYVLQRYIDSAPVGMLAYMLGGYKRFNQVNTKFPNLYLIKSQKFIHPPTYWLKRLLLEYMYYNCKNSLENNVRNIVQLFSDEENSSKAYPHDLVLECLGSLSEVHESRVTDSKLRLAASKDSIIPDILFLTPRGLYLAEKLKDRFIYLQLVVEDNYLPIPNILINEFKYSTTDYGYLVYPQEDYKKNIKEMIPFKARQVLLFIELLDAAKEYEELQYEIVWKRLEGIIYLNLDELRSSIINEFENINNSFGKHFNFKIPINDYCNDAKALRPKIDDFFLRCI